MSSRSGRLYSERTNDDKSTRSETSIPLSQHGKTHKSFLKIKASIFQDYVFKQQATPPKSVQAERRRLSISTVEADDGKNHTIYMYT